MSDTERRTLRVVWHLQRTQPSGPEHVTYTLSTMRWFMLGYAFGALVFRHLSIQLEFAIFEGNDRPFIHHSLC